MNHFPRLKEVLFKVRRWHQQQQRETPPHICKSLRHTQDCPHPGCGTAEPHTVELPCLCVRAGTPEIPWRLAFPGAKPGGAPRFLQGSCTHAHTHTHTRLSLVEHQGFCRPHAHICTHTHTDTHTHTQGSALWSTKVSVGCIHTHTHTHTRCFPLQQSLWGFPG